MSLLVPPTVFHPYEQLTSYSQLGEWATMVASSPNSRRKMARYCPKELRMMLLIHRHDLYLYVKVVQTEMIMHKSRNATNLGLSAKLKNRETQIAQN